MSRLVLTAPDIDADVFRDLAESVKRATSHVTLYASSADLALTASKHANGFRRAGDATPLTIVPGIDTVDASTLATDFLGHSYFGDHVSVISDIRCLLSGTAPDGRYGLSRRADGLRVFWRFVSDVQLMACMANGRNCACGAPG